MPDASFDAVIIGGGNKALFTAMYLAKYGGMDVGIFERRHELGGGLSSQESPAPGFIGDTHASTLFEWYYEPVEEDFPDFVEKGGKMTHYPTTYGIITKEDQKFFGIYHHSVDPTGEKTAKELARFSERDAETYMKIFDVVKPGGSFSLAWNEAFFSVPPPPEELDPVERWLQDYLKTPDCPIDLAWTMMPANRAALEMWDSVELQLMTLKRMKTMGMPTEMTGALSSLFAMGQSCSQSYAVGGTHSIAHACQRIFLDNGGKFFTKNEVVKVLLEGGEAKGIRLADGTEVEARKVVVGAIDPHQLCFELVGKEHLDRKLVRRLETVMRGLTCITWYTWAV
ncbi:MAG: FAD-dependent oxidoreductase, partial [Dehalococcoidia bacterium]|nr:FAD-dependent oxidoreductase [Dehalococcoidia bacterium]